ncbi:MAG TPA: PAS domain S-box protein [Acidimicrobiales bacterium]|nr:PAS domain S-box protein [Acidimicrobiales bacterium]
MDATGADDEQRIAELLAAVQASSDAIYVVDADGMITSWNRSAERILGYAASDAIGRPVSILVPAHRVDDPAVFARVMHGERIERHETEQCRRDGSLVPVWLTVLPVRDQSGRVVGASFAARDVAELDMAQATLADAESRLREGEALAHIGGWTWDVDTDAVQWSDELFRIHGVDPLEFAGMLEDHLAPVAPDQRQAVRVAMWRPWRTVRTAGTSTRSAGQTARPARSGPSPSRCSTPAAG